MSSPLKQNTATIQNLLNTINSLPEAGTDLPELTNEGSASDLLSGKQLIDSDGNVLEGTFTIDEELSTQNSLITQLQNIVDNLPESGGDDTSMEDILVTRNFNSYINSRVTSIGSYAFAYCSSLTSVSFPAATFIGDNAFQFCSNLTTVSFPSATTIGSNAFYSCTRLTSVSFPSATTIGSSAFQGCSSLTSVSFPTATFIGNNAFQYCDSLTTVSFPAVINIGGFAFNRCYNLISLYLMGSSICALSNSVAFISTPIGGYSTSAGTYGSIFVPTSLLASYKAATNWTYFSSRFVGV